MGDKRGEWRDVDIVNVHAIKAEGKSSDDFKSSVCDIFQFIQRFGGPKDISNDFRPQIKSNKCQREQPGEFFAGYAFRHIGFHVLAC